MAQKRIASHIRTHRKKSGFTQHELAGLLGHDNALKVWRHERGITVPPLTDALTYAAIFRVPVGELFPAVQQAVAQNLADRFVKLEAALGRKTSRDRDAKATAQKLQFIAVFKNRIEI
jgi:DNA-binding XRE family transcriptional regulator